MNRIEQIHKLPFVRIVLGGDGMSTPGRRKALRALAARKRSNRSRVQRGLKPIVKDPKTGKTKKVSARSLGIRKRSK